MATTNTLELAARLGFAARGLMYILIGYLTLRAGRSEDGAGILEYLSNGGGGRWLVGAMAAGFLGYALWRLTEAWTDPSRRGAATRIAAGLSGLTHLGLAFIAAKLALGERGGGGDSAQQGAARALDLPGGWLLLLAVAAILAATGIFQLIKSYKARFLRDLAPQVARQAWVRVAGRIGYAARGFVFLIVAWFFTRAGLEARHSAVGGLAEALDSLPSSLETAVAIGLIGFGLFSLIEARHRRIATP